jgi:hypothetical protein
MTVGFICGPGPYEFLVLAKCPWCCLGEDTTVVAARWVYGGWCGCDFLCGACGQSWSTDDDRPLGRLSEDERERNLARVAEMRTRMEPGPWPTAPALELDRAEPGQDGKE